MHRPAKYRINRVGTHYLIKRLSRLNGEWTELKWCSNNSPIYLVRYQCSVRTNGSNQQQHMVIRTPFQRRTISTLSQQRVLPISKICLLKVHKFKGMNNDPNKCYKRGNSHSGDSNAAYGCSTPYDGIRNFCRVTDSKYTELYLEEVFESGVGEDDPLGDLRNILYPEKLKDLTEQEEEHDLLYRLSHAGSVKDVLSALSEQDEDAIEPHHMAQAISTLHYMQKLSAMVINYLDEDENRLARVQYNRVLMKEPEFIVLIDRLSQHIPELSVDIAAYLFQCLRRLEQPLISPIMVNFTTHLKKHVDQMDSKALSYFAIGIGGRTSNKSSKLHETSLLKIFTLAPAVPKLNTFIDNMESAEDVHQIAICINMMASLVSNRCMEKFYLKLDDIISRGEFIETNANMDQNETSSSTMQLSALVKVLSIYLKKKDWHLSRAETIRKVLYLLKGRIVQLRPDQLAVAAKVAYDIGEPATIIYELDKNVRKLFEMQRIVDVENNELYYLTDPHVLQQDKKPYDQKEETNNNGSAKTGNPSLNLRSYIPRVDFLYMMTLAKLGKVDAKITQSLVVDSLKSQLFPIYISQLFEILRNSSVGNDQSLVNQFLNRSFEVCHLNMLELCRLSIRYTNFNSVMGGIVRDREFETKVIEEFQRDILTNPYPVEFASEFGFLLSYCDVIKPAVFERFHTMLGQLKPFHLYTIARGLETRFQWLPNSIPPELKPKRIKRSTNKEKEIQTLKRKTG